MARNPTPSTPWRRRPRLGLAVLLALAFCEVGFRQDELDCEQAVSHLVSCCPQRAPSEFDCSYSAGCGQATYPQLNIEQSQCLEGMDCTTIQSAGWCSPSATVNPSCP
jgi:hypothetical protein